MSTSRTETQYRILSRAPGERRFKWRHFTYSIGSRADIDRGLALAHEHGADGWEYRIQQRTITTITTEWETTDEALR